MKRIALLLVMIGMTYGLPQGATTATDTEGGGGIHLFYSIIKISNSIIHMSVCP